MSRKQVTRSTKHISIESNMKVAVPEKEKRRILFTIAGCLIAPLGIACFRLAAWTLYTSNIGAIGTNFTFISRTLQFLVMLLLVIIDRHISYDKTLFFRTTGVAAIGMASGVVIFLAAPNELNWYIGCGINGACSAVLMLGWGYYLCSVDSRRSAYGLTLAFAVYAVSTWALSVIPSQLLIILMAIFPLLSYLCLKLSVTDNIAQTGAEYPSPEHARALIPWDIVSILSICTVISILAKLLIPLNTVSSSTYLVVWPLIIVFIFLFYTVWMIILKREDHDALWPLFVLIIFSGLLCYSSLAAMQPSFASGFFKATQECFMLFCWIVTASAVYRIRLPRVFFFGLAVLIFLEPPTLVSSMLSMLFATVQTVETELLAIIITTIMAFILVVASVALITANSIRNTRRYMKELNVEQSGSFVPNAVESIITKYGLTKREGELVYFLIRGYTFPQIASTLVLSIDTVRTHIKSIYRKAGIHKKQQLILMVEKNVESLMLQVKVSRNGEDTTLSSLSLKNDGKKLD
jgi:DNA-binding CsgD family transcriptional regulator